MHKEQYKPGVKVRHKRYKHYGVGCVKKISKSGERAQVKWHSRDLYFYGYYRLDLLEVVQDD